MPGSKQRYISTSFWDDPWVQRLDPAEKFLYLYLLTNPLTNIAGVYELTIRRMSFDTGYTSETIEGILEKFERDAKAFYFERWIILPSWPKHQKITERSKIFKGIIGVLKELPETVFAKLEEVGYAFDLEAVEVTVIAREQRKKISGATRKAVLDKTGGVCATCGNGGRLEMHHVVTVLDGGTNAIENLVPLCPACHRETFGGDHDESRSTYPFLKEPQSTYPFNYRDSDSERDSDPDIDPDSESNSDSEETPGITFEIPEGVAPSHCRGCNAPIYWVKTAKGKNMPVDPDGTSHFVTCPQANHFRKERGA